MPRRQGGNEIHNPAAYDRAVRNNIKANAWTTKRRAFEAQLEAETLEFRDWILGVTPKPLQVLSDAAQAAFEADPDGMESDATDATHRAYQKAMKEHYARVGHRPEFLVEALNKWGGLTPKQLEFAKRRFAENLARGDARHQAEAARKGAASAWTPGRQAVTGVVQSARYETKELGFGHVSGAYKVLLLTPEQRKLWTSIPKAMWPAWSSEDRAESLKGQTLSFKVTVTPSVDDPTMGFGSRPR